MYNCQTLILIGLLILHATDALEFNIAVEKVVTTSNNVTDHLATMVIDQYLNTYVQVNSEINKFAWIFFDLKGVYNITKIIIWPTNDDDFVLARVFVNIRLIYYTAYAPNDLYCTYAGPARGIAFNCSKPDKQLGKFVVLNKLYLSEPLKIAEVAILTSDTEFLVPITGQVEQSYVFHNLTTYNALKAIDGDVNTCIHTGEDSEAYRIIPGWWRTDLGENYQVSAININDYNTQQPYRGDYSVYVDKSGFNKQQLCLFFNQFNTFFQLKCDSVLTGRYLTVERISSAFRPDALIFCEIQVVASHKDSVYTFPTYYIGISTTSSTITPIPSSPTSPLTSPTTKTPSTSLTANPTSATVKIQIRQDKVFQNHDFKDSPSAAKFAVDNILETCSYTAQEDINNRNKVGWWRADLEDIYDVVYVIITDRLVSLPVSGYINIFIDRDNNTQSQLCLSFDKATSIYDQYTNLTCTSRVTGRFLTISKIPGRYRMDALGLCEVQVYGYLNSPTTTTTTTTNTTDMPSDNVIKKLQQKVQNQETEKILIGVVTSIITAILFSIFGFVCGNIYQKKKSVKPTEATIYDRTKVENVEQHVYSDLNNTTMKEINTYYNENK